ncbi:MAG: quinolinate synthase NadA, partial [Deltaproteobacteria bacterium]|nr:quinolinate synthase NadA [Deltaproteobacteria bacterium]
TCIVHETFSERKLIDLMTERPEARVIAHPECEPPLLRLAHHIGSTSSLLKYTRESGYQTFIVATEPGIIHQMTKENPEAEYIALPGMDDSCACNECPFMRLNTLEKIVLALRDLEPRVEMDEALRVAALKPLERMMALG